MSKPPVAASHPVLLGGRYRLRGELGRGGMARVHRAHDQALDRDVAVKILHPELAHDPVLLDRFRREAWAGARLSHPNVVAVYDVGTPDPSGSHDQPAYLVMQLVDGPSLRDVLYRHRRLSAGQALGILGQAAAGLAAAHDAGLVHRDVKPENVLLTRQGGVKVTDFGLARAAAESTQTFGSDVIVGSPHYLSPEAVGAEPVDARSDVYSLGLLLYECLTGRPPFEGDSPLTTALQHRSDRVPRPSAAVSGVAADVDAVVLAATARDPAQRYQDARAFADALAAAVPEGPAPLAEDPSWRDTAVIPLDATDTVVGAGGARAGGIAAEGHEVDGPEAGGPEVGGGAAGAEAAGADDASAVTDEDRHDAHDEGGGRRRGWLRVVVLAVPVLLALAGFLVWDNVLAPVTPVPAVAGSPAGDARAELEDAGFVVEIAEDRPYDLDVPAGSVLRQDPAGEARRGTAVSLVLSDGPRPVEVPTVSGRPQQEVVAQLEQLGLKVSAERAFDEEVSEGRVVSIEPSAGEVVDEGSDVALVVSDGPHPIEVPDVGGESEAAALEALRERGLDPQVVDRRYDDQVPEGTVLGQSPQSGATLTRDGRVELVVSRGPEPFEMPNVRRQRVGDAREQLESVGLDVEVEQRGGVASLLNPGRVYDQDPAPGTRVLPGEAVTLYAYEG